MHCPRCGQMQLTEETRFCSGCGFLLAGVAHVVANDGLLPKIESEPRPQTISPRRRGVMQGLFFFLLSFLVVPIIIMITVALKAEPFAVVVASVIFVVGGLLRVVYSLMFESAENLTTGHGEIPVEPGRLPNCLPAAIQTGTGTPASAYEKPRAGMWRDIHEQFNSEPNTITDSTTKLLEHEYSDQ